VSLTTQIIRVSDKKWEPKEITAIAKDVSKGQLVIFPTETVYGIGALCTRPKSVQQIYRIKGREKRKPMAYHLGAIKQLNQVPFQRTAIFEALRKRFWPGPLTMIVRGKANQTIGLRFPLHDAARAMIRHCQGPLLATSANRSGQPPTVSGKTACDQFSGKVKWIMDGGKTKMTTASTVVDISSVPYRIVRKGPKNKEVERVLKQHGYGY